MNFKERGVQEWGGTGGGAKHERDPRPRAVMGLQTSHVERIGGGRRGDRLEITLPSSEKHAQNRKSALGKVGA